MAWKKMVRNCFGEVDHLFAMHNTEDEFATHMVTMAAKEGATINEIVKAVDDFLIEEGVLPKFRKEEVARAKNVIKKKIASVKKKG